MKILRLEKTTVGSSECEVIMLYDQANKRSSYVYTNEVGYQDWVNQQINAYKNNGYNIENNT